MGYLVLSFSVHCAHLISTDIFMSVKFEDSRL